MFLPVKLTVFCLGLIPRLILYEPRKAEALKSCFVIQGKGEELECGSEGHLGWSWIRGWMQAAVPALPRVREGPAVQG